MAKEKFAKVVAKSPLDHESLITLQIEDLDDFQYLAGKYIIIDTKIPLGAKTIKRAYTIIRKSKDQITLAAQKVGPGSNFLDQLKLDDPISFSGPWGKFLPSNLLRKRFSAWPATQASMVFLVFCRSRPSPRRNSMLPGIKTLMLPFFLKIWSTNFYQSIVK